MLESSKIELTAAKIKATKRLTSDIPGVPDPPLITTFGKKSFNLAQATVISFSLIVIYEGNYLYSNYEIVFY